MRVKRRVGVELSALSREKKDLVAEIARGHLSKTSGDTNFGMAVFATDFRPGSGSPLPFAHEYPEIAEAGLRRWNGPELASSPSRES